MCSLREDFNQSISTFGEAQLNVSQDMNEVTSCAKFCFCFQNQRLTNLSAEVIFKPGRLQSSRIRLWSLDDYYFPLAAQPIQNVKVYVFSSTLVIKCKFTQVINKKQPHMLSHQQNQDQNDPDPLIFFL